MFNDFDNPYASPADSLDGHYDWSLAKRMFLAVSLLACFCLLCNAVVLYGSWSAGQFEPGTTWVDQLKNLMLDWKSL